jgi:hypothetical protein
LFERPDSCPVETPRWGVYLETSAGFGLSYGMITEDVTPTRLYRLPGGLGIALPPQELNSYGERFADFKIGDITFIPLWILSLMLPRMLLIGKNMKLILKRHKPCGMIPTVWRFPRKLRMNLGGWS